MNFASFKEREAAFEVAKNRDVLAVAKELGLEMIRAGQTYYWEAHDSFVIDPNKNIFYWNSQAFGGNAIKLVQTIKETDFRTAVAFLAGRDFKVFDQKAYQPKPFVYQLNEDRTFDLARHYLHDERRLSHQTIDTFKEKGLIAEAIKRSVKTGQNEPVVVFKDFNRAGDMKGTVLQGIRQNDDYGKRGHLKETHGPGYHGFTIRVGNPPRLTEATGQKPLTIIAFEAPIDLMSYYELFQHHLQDVILVSMNGVRDGVISTLLADEMKPGLPDDIKLKALSVADRAQVDRVKLILAVDHDQAGKEFVNKIQKQYPNLTVVPHLPKIMPGETKGDWNNVLQALKRQQKQPNAFEQRVAVAREQAATQPVQARETTQARRI
jgi:hypothetical protein